jgi:5'-nucleotidase
MVTRLAQQLTHPRREEETALGNLFSDIWAERSGADFMLVGSGSIRQPVLGPVVTLGNLRTIYPYDGPLFRTTVTGADLKRAFSHWMRPENRNSEGECYQVNRSVRAVYNNNSMQLDTLTFDGRPVMDEGRYKLCLQDYHLKNAQKFFGLTDADLSAFDSPAVVATSSRDVLEEYLRRHQLLNSAVEGRLVYV